MKILLTAIGKRVELIKHLKTRFTVVGADCSDLNPAKYFVDKFCLIPRVTDGEYIPTLLRVCKEEKIDYLIPLLENEFPILDKAREDFEKTMQELMKHGFGTVIVRDRNDSRVEFENLNGYFKFPSDEEIEVE